MEYKFTRGNCNYSHYASGRVLYNQQGTTAFPVRLASEIFQRCAALLEQDGAPGPYSLYDPCCGGGYLLTTLGFLHPDKIAAIHASDVDGKVAALAQRNLGLLKPEGLHQRILQIKELIQEHGKASHREALESALHFQEILQQQPHPVNTHCYVWDITQGASADNPAKNMEMILTDLPYGELVHWQGTWEPDKAVALFMENIRSVLTPGGMAAIICQKKTRLEHPQFFRRERFQLGKRQVLFLQKGRTADPASDSL